MNIAILWLKLSSQRFDNVCSLEVVSRTRDEQVVTVLIGDQNVAGHFGAQFGGQQEQRVGGWR